MLAEAHPALRGVHERAAPAAPPSPPDRLHFSQSAPNILPPDHGLVGDVSRLVYRMMQGLYSAAAGRKIQGAAVIAYASGLRAIQSPLARHLS